MDIQGVVTRERVRNALHSLDPLYLIRNWPGLATRRHPYSVAGPNSLWHTGNNIAMCFISLYCSFDVLYMYIQSPQVVYSLLFFLWKCIFNAPPSYKCLLNEG